MAQRYTFADRMFQSNTGPSFPAHLYLVAGQSAYASANPNHMETTRFAWGCDSPTTATVTQLAPDGDEKDPQFPCLDFRTIADELDDFGLPWRYYSPSIDSLGNIWSAFDAIYHVRYSMGWKNVVSPETRVLGRRARRHVAGRVVGRADGAQLRSRLPAEGVGTRHRAAGRGRPGVGAVGRQRHRQGPVLEVDRRSSSCGTTGAAGTTTSRRRNSTA